MNKRLYRHSIKKQFAAIFILSMVGTILACFFINTFFLEDFYCRKKTAALMNAYHVINAASINDTITSENVSIEIQKLCSKNNISMIIIENDNQILASSMSDAQQLLNQLWNNQFMQEDELEQKNIDIIEQTENYTLQKNSDIRTKADYIEMWGVLDTGKMFLIRIAMESIKDSAQIANRFFLYVGGVISIISAFIIYFITRKVTKPIQQLADISEKMANLDFNEKCVVKGKNEITLLGTNMNALSDALQTTISELKTANNELKNDIAKKEEIDEMRKEFLSNVSHELKTPIALIQGYAEGLHDGINDDEESRNYYCEVIMDEAMKMNEMVKKLLALNQLEFGQDNISMEQFDIAEVIRDYIKGSDILIKQHKAVVRVNAEDSIMVWADEDKTLEVFNNYFTNALNHLSGELIIDIKIETIAEHTVKVSVFNSGDPIPEESINRIWEKFYKVDKARTREYGGSGVGLSIVKAIMESMNQHYGVINFKNGVEFWFELEKQ